MLLCMTMWGYLVGLCHDTVVPEIFMEGVRRFVTCLMFCWSWLNCIWVQLGYFSTLTPDCFQEMCAPTISVSSRFAYVFAYRLIFSFLCLLVNLSSCLLHVNLCLLTLIICRFVCFFSLFVFWLFIILIVVSLVFQI